MFNGTGPCSTWHRPGSAWHMCLKAPIGEHRMRAPSAEVRLDGVEDNAQPSRVEHGQFRRTRAVLHFHPYFAPSLVFARQSPPTHGGLYAWELQKGGREIRVKVEGQLVFNGTGPMLDAASSGFGLAYVPKTRCRRTSPTGASSGCSPIGSSYSGYHLDYPNRRQPTPAFHRRSLHCATGVEAGKISGPHWVWRGLGALAEFSFITGSSAYGRRSNIVGVDHHFGTLNRCDSSDRYGQA